MQRKMPPLDQWAADPSGGDDCAKLAMRKERNVAVHRAQTCDQPVGARRDFCGRLTAWNAVLPNIPVWAHLPDIGGPQAFVIAIVPLRQIGFNLAHLPEAGQLASLPGTQSRTDEYTSEPDLPQERREFTRPVLAVCSQGEIGASGVLTGDRPGGLAMPN